MPKNEMSFSPKFEQTPVKRRKVEDDSGLAESEPVRVSKLSARSLSLISSLEDKIREQQIELSQKEDQKLARKNISLDILKSIVTINKESLKTLNNLNDN